MLVVEQAPTSRQGQARPPIRRQKQNIGAGPSHAKVARVMEKATCRLNGQLLGVSAWSAIRGASFELDMLASDGLWDVPFACRRIKSRTSNVGDLEQSCHDSKSGPVNIRSVDSIMVGREGANSWDPLVIVVRNHIVLVKSLERKAVVLSRYSFNNRKTKCKSCAIR
ncbi:hypothetical protein BDV19DRAFT_250502 [Aspergillus venezuelensis]